MEKKTPAFHFYPKDWLSDLKVRAMTPAQRGYYIDLISYMWTEGGKLPSDVKKLMALLNASSEDVNVLLECFENNGEFLIQKRLEKEIVKLEAWREKSVKAATKRWEIENQKKLKSKGETRKQRIERKAKEFKAKLNQHHKDFPKKYPPAMYLAFFQYWGIPENKTSPMKLVYENERSWSLNARLGTWFRRERDNGQQTEKVKIKTEAWQND